MADSVATHFADHADEIEVYLMRRIGDRQVAADLLHDTFVRASEHDDRELIQNPRAYLYRIASNLATDHQRRQARSPAVPMPEAAAEAVADERPGAVQIMEGRDRLARVHAAIGELPDLTQRIFRLNRLEGLSYAQVARELEISESSVQKHLARALQHALAAIEDETDPTITGSPASNVLSLRAALKARRR